MYIYKTINNINDKKFIVKNLHIIKNSNYLDCLDPIWQKTLLIRRKFNKIKPNGFILIFGFEIEKIIVNNINKNRSLCQKQKNKNKPNNLD